MTRVYIGGPITGKLDLNKPAFDAAEQMLIGLGDYVFNPHSIAEPDEKDIPEEVEAAKKWVWRYYMRNCISELVKCDELYLLAGWQNSDGAVWEYRIANMLGMPVRYEHVPD